MAEAEYQLAATKGKAAEYHDRVETMSHERDGLEELVLAMKLYTLGGVAAVKDVGTREKEDVMVSSK